MYVIKVREKFFISISNNAIKREQAEIYETYEEAKETADLIGGKVYKISLEEEQ